MPAKDAEANRAAQKKYYDKNREKILQNKIARRIRNGYTVGETRYETSVPIKRSQELYNLDEKFINKVRKDMDLDPIKLACPLPDLPALVDAAVERIGNERFDELSEEAQQRIITEAAGGVPPRGVSTDTQIEARRATDIVLPEEVIAAFQKLVENDQISKGTATNYSKRFLRVIKYLGGDAASNVIELLKNPEEVKSKIVEGLEKNNLSLNSLKDYINVLSTLCRVGRDYLPSYCDNVPVQEYAKLMSEERNISRLEVTTKTQTDYVVPYKEIQKALANIMRTAPNSTDHLIILLYNIVAWRDNVGDLKIWKGADAPPPDGMNYYSPSKNMIYLRDYKTKRQFGAKEYKMPDSVKEIFEVQNAEAGGNKKYLVSKPDGSRIGSGKLGAMIPKAFKAAGIKEPVTINTIRHSTVANLYNNSKASAEQKLRLANEMNHSPMVAYTVYTRPNFDEDKQKVRDFTSRVAKFFDDELFFGWATKSVGEQYYKIAYDDGDRQDMNTAEFKTAAALAQKYKSKDSKG